MRTKNVDYLIGYHEERARRAAGNYAMDAMSVARNMRRDELHKARLLAQFPRAAHAMDATELAQASATEIAIRALMSEGMDVPTDADPLELIDAYGAGRKSGVEGSNRSRTAFDGRVMDGSDVGGKDFVSKHINGDAAD